MEDLSDSFFYSECRKCQQVAFSEAAALAHEKACDTTVSSIPRVVHACSSCDFKSTDPAQLSKHRLSKGHGCFACNLCQRYFSSTKRGLADHKRSVHERERIDNGHVSAIYRRYFNGQ